MIVISEARWARTPDDYKQGDPATGTAKMLVMDAITGETVLTPVKVVPVAPTEAKAGR